VPALIAAVCLIIVFAGFAVSNFGARQKSNQALALSTKLPGINESNIQNLVSTLDQTKPSQFITIQAPANAIQLPANSVPIYVIYDTANQKPTIMTFPAEEGSAR